MADSGVNITEGSGLVVDSRTETTNGNHRQVVILGDPATNAGVAPVDATNGLAVDVKQSALPSGAATAAHQVTQNGYLDGVEGLLTTIDADTGNILTSVQLIDDAIRTEDAAETAGTGLMMAGSVRRDTAASSAGTTGDNATINTDSAGKLWVTGTVLEDVAHSAGEQLSPSGVRRIDTPATSAGTSGDWATMDASAEGALWTTNTPTTTGGCSIFRTLDLDESEEDVKTAAGNVYGYYFYNASTSVRYLKFYNATAANVKVGTTTPVLTLPLPASSAGHISFGFPVGFSTAICVATTTGLADNDTGAPSTNDVILNVFYK